MCALVRVSGCDVIITYSHLVGFCWTRVSMCVWWMWRNFFEFISFKYLMYVKKTAFFYAPHTKKPTTTTVTTPAHTLPNISFIIRLADWRMVLILCFECECDDVLNGNLLHFNLADMFVHATTQATQFNSTLRAINNSTSSANYCVSCENKKKKERHR